jgi:hypothetical protein
MFKIKKTIIDRYLMLGSFVSVIFTVTTKDRARIYWKILFYDPDTGLYKRSTATRNSFGEMDEVYELHTNTHWEIREFIKKGTWQIFKTSTNGIQI